MAEFGFSLAGEHGNAFFIMGMTKRELRKAGYTKEQLDEYQNEATSSDYDNLLAVTRRYLDEADIDMLTV